MENITDNSNLYQSAEGFSVEVLGRTGLAYRESGKEMFVDSEVLTGDTGMVVYRDSVSNWKPPHDDIPVSDADRERIVQNIRHVFRQQGFQIDVI